MSKQVLGVLCSGRGTDLQSIIDAIGRGEVDATIAVVLTDKPDAYALTRAKTAGIKAVCIDRKQFDGRQPFEEALIAALDEAGVTLVVLAGFMRILTPYFVRHYAGRIMNIHPALLPSFTGAHAIDDAFARGVKVTGVTVHFANEIYDNGPIIAQRALAVEEGWDVDTLEEHIHAIEHVLYPEVVQMLADGRVHVLESGKVAIDAPRG